MLGYILHVSSEVYDCIIVKFGHYLNASRKSSQVKSTTLHGTLLLKKFSEQMFVSNRKVGKIYRIVNFSWSCADINELRRVYFSEIVRTWSPLQYKHCKMYTSYRKGTLMMSFSKY